MRNPRRLLQLFVLVTTIIYLSACGGLATESATIPAPTVILVNVINMPGVVIADLVPILSGPGVEFDQVFTIPQGTSITVVGKSADDQWYMVSLPGYSGSPRGLWIPVNLVTIISPTETVTMTAAGFTPAPAPTETITSMLSIPSPIPAIQRSRSCGAHTGWIVYLVQPGDNLFRLALKTNSTVNQIMAANCLTSNRILAGRTLYLPFIAPADTLTLTPTQTPTDTPTASATLSPTPLAPENYLTNFQAIRDTPLELQFTLDYHYNGADGEIAFYAGCLDHGAEMPCAPDPLRLEGPSSGTLFFTLTYFGDGTETFTTDAIIVFVYTSDGILVFEDSFSYVKTWFVVSETATTVP